MHEIKFYYEIIKATVRKQSNIHSKQLRMGVFQLTKVIIFFRIYNLQPWVFSESVSSKIRIDEIDFAALIDLDQNVTAPQTLFVVAIVQRRPIECSRFHLVDAIIISLLLAFQPLPTPSLFALLFVVSLSFLASSCYTITTWSLFYSHKIRLLGVSPSRFSSCITEQKNRDPSRSYYVKIKRGSYPRFIGAILGGTGVGLYCSPSI